MLFFVWAGQLISIKWDRKYMMIKMGQALLILEVILFVVGAVGIVFEFLPLNIIVAMGALAIIFVGAGASIKRKVQK